MSSPKPSRLEVVSARAPDSGGKRIVDWFEAVTRWLGRRIASWIYTIERLIELFRIRPPETAYVLERIQRMERDIVLPAKLAAIGIVIYQFYFTRWVVDRARTVDVPIEYAHYLLWFWIAANLFSAWVLFTMRRRKTGLVEWSVFSNSLLDGIFLGVLTVGTGGYNSMLYWIFLALIMRGAVSVPRATSQLLLNLTLSTCYVLAGVMDTFIARQLDQSERDLVGLDTGPAEPLLLRLTLLLLMTFGCYAIQVLLERQRQVEEEAREFAVREVRLRSAGRLAAEFAHQIKNPLAIINNAAYTLQKNVREGKPPNAQQVGIIQEEVDRADRIITEVMGYAQLSEGHVEKLDVIEELNLAIDRVFPAAAEFPVEVQRKFGAHFPPLLMQRRHASEVFMNILQNAREALETRGGHVSVTADCREDRAIEVRIADDGPGVPPDKISRIFEAYYTTKEKGTGLGLATVKHNMELYNGTVRVESELGKGACFVLIFPAKTFMKGVDLN